VLCEAQDEANRTEFMQLLAKKNAQDQLRLLSKDGKSINTFEGFVGEADAAGEKVEFKSDGETLPVSLARVRGVIFSRKLEEPAAKPVCRLFDGFQNVFMVASVKSSADGFQLQTPAGVSVDMGRTLVQRFDFSLGKIAYLSDLDPLRVEEAPILADLWHYRRDKNLEGGTLSLARKAYSKGLAVHSRTLLEYDVKGYETFRCMLGIDDSVTGPGNAVVRIEADGKEIFTTTVKNVTKEDRPKEVELKIGGVNRLRLIVDYGDDLDLGDHVVFAEARVSK
jgi:hypothetical protein